MRVLFAIIVVLVVPAAFGARTLTAQDALPTPRGQLGGAVSPDLPQAGVPTIPPLLPSPAATLAIVPSAVPAPTVSPATGTFRESVTSMTALSLVEVIDEHGSVAIGALARTRDVVIVPSTTLEAKDHWKVVGFDGASATVDRVTVDLETNLAALYLDTPITGGARFESPVPPVGSAVRVVVPYLPKPGEPREQSAIVVSPVVSGASADRLEWIRFRVGGTNAPTSGVMIDASGGLVGLVVARPPMVGDSDPQIGFALSAAALVQTMERVVGAATPEQHPVLSP